ncbi:MAG: DUF3644 domain-containing protein [Herbaspirillum sp.]|nr:DUF3644 domain-containing protein [Herbaspirillum sp.]
MAAMVAAIEIYNKPVFMYREETFAVLAINAWELLLKAKWLKDHGNKLASLYVPDTSAAKQAVSKSSSKTPRPRYKTNRAGNSMTHSLDHFVKGLVASKALDLEVERNLLALTEVRDNSIHFYNDNPNLSERLQELGTAAVKNFVIASQDWFSMDYADYNFHLMPLAFFNPAADAEAIVLTREQRRVVSYIENMETNSESKRHYAVSVNVSLKFVRSTASHAMAVQLSNDPDAMPIHMTEDQITARYPLSYDRLQKRCRERYSDFLANDKFHGLRVSVAQDPKYCRVRELDPGNPKTLKKVYFSESILTFFDKHYQKK